MPIYEFHCEKCGKDSEVLVASSRWEGTPCPKCGSKKLTKKLSVFAASVPETGIPSGCTGSPSPCCCSCSGGHHHH